MPGCLWWNGTRGHMVVANPAIHRHILPLLRPTRTLCYLARLKGVAEADLARDVRATMLRFLYGASSNVPPAQSWRPVIPNDQGNGLDHLALPTELPPWLSEADLAYYTAEFTRTGFSGGLNWYRNIDRNWELLAAYSGAPITRPALFLWGDRDPSLALPGMDKRIERMQQVVPNLHKLLLPGCGHWVQQERSQEVNTAILAFLKSLEYAEAKLVELVSRYSSTSLASTFRRMSVVLS